MTPKLRHLMALVAVVAVGLSVFRWFASCAVAHWVGGFPLDVALEDRSGRSVVAVAVEAVAQMAEAEFFTAHPESPELHLDGVNWVAGQTFTVWVRSGGTSMSGRELSYHHYQGLIVRVEYADGTNRLLSVRIPGGRGPRRVSVSVP